MPFISNGQFFIHKGTRFGKSPTSVLRLNSNNHNHHSCLSTAEAPKAIIPLNFSKRLATSSIIPALTFGKWVVSSSNLRWGNGRFDSTSIPKSLERVVRRWISIWMTTLAKIVKKRFGDALLGCCTSNQVTDRARLNWFQSFKVIFNNLIHSRPAAKRIFAIGSFLRNPVIRSLQQRGTCSHQWKMEDGQTNRLHRHPKMKIQYTSRQ
jgi:hypothetical protein